MFKDYGGSGKSADWGLLCIQVCDSYLVDCASVHMQVCSVFHVIMHLKAGTFVL